MIRKFVAAMSLLMAVVAVTGAAPAAAGGGAPDYADCIVMVSPPQFRPGQVVTVQGRGFQPNFTTTIEFHSVVVVIGTVTTDSRGRFVTRVRIPADATPGPHTITAGCDDQGNVGTDEVEVRAEAAEQPSGADPLPQTGSDVEPLLVVAGAALLAGGAFVLVARRRRRAHAA